MAPAEHAAAIEDAALAYAEARHTQGSDAYNGTTYAARQELKAAISAAIAAEPSQPVAVPEGIYPAASKSHGAWDGIEDVLEMPDGTDIYTAAQVQAMLAAAKPAVQAREPLTDAQIEQCIPDDDTPMGLGEAFMNFARAIEAAHGIKP